LQCTNRNFTTITIQLQSLTLFGSGRSGSCSSFAVLHLADPRVTGPPGESTSYKGSTENFSSSLSDLSHSLRSSWQAETSKSSKAWDLLRGCFIPSGAFVLTLRRLGIRLGYISGSLVALYGAYLLLVYRGYVDAKEGNKLGAIPVLR